MKIGFPAQGQGKEMEKKLSENFIESGLIGVFDTEDKSIAVTSKENMENGIMDWLKENEIEAIVTPYISSMGLKVFREQSVQVYKSEGRNLTINMELILNGQLSIYATDTLQADSSCSTNCNSCSSSSCN